MMVGGTMALVMDAHSTGSDLASQFQWRISQATDFVLGREVHWAILVAAFHAARGLWRNTRFLIANGPPFMGPGMGCGMRIAVLILAVILVPAFAIFGLAILQNIGVRWNPASDSIPFVWLIWGLYVSAELLTLWFLWDIQRKLISAGVDPSKL
jgi:hypothetical protein